MARPNHLTEWEFFVIRHQKTGTILFHVFSLMGPIFSLIMLIQSMNPIWLVPLFLTWSLGTVGHYLFEDGTVRAVDFIRLETLTSLFRICFMILRGTYSKEVQRVIALDRQNTSK